MFHFYVIFSVIVHLCSRNEFYNKIQYILEAVDYLMQPGNVDAEMLKQLEETKVTLKGEALDLSHIW